jgi:hypothetical protein
MTRKERQRRQALEAYTQRALSKGVYPATLKKKTPKKTPKNALVPMSAYLAKESKALWGQQLSTGLTTGHTHDNFYVPPAAMPERKALPVENLDDAPLCTEYVVGFRVWKTNHTDKHPFLNPLSMIEGAWNVGENTAQCKAGAWWTEHLPCKDAPHKDCQCGLHAYFEIAEAVAENQIVGAVKAWGKTIIQSNGFRAEKCEVIGILNTGWQSAPVAEFYKVPLVETTKELTELALSMGSTVENLRPEEEWDDMDPYGQNYLAYKSKWRQPAQQNTMWHIWTSTSANS